MSASSNANTIHVLALPANSSPKTDEQANVLWNFNASCFSQREYFPYFLQTLSSLQTNAPPLFQLSCTCHSDSTEKEATGLTDWRQITRDTGAEVLLETTHRDGEVPQAGGDAPHHGESDERELTAPPQGDEDSAQRRHDVVAAVLAAVEAGIAGLPHTVYAVGARGLGQDVLKAHLKVYDTNRLYFYQLETIY